LSESLQKTEVLGGVLTRLMNRVSQVINVGAEEPFLNLAAHEVGLVENFSYNEREENELEAGVVGDHHMHELRLVELLQLVLLGSNVDTVEHYSNEESGDEAGVPSH